MIRLCPRPACRAPLAAAVLLLACAAGAPPQDASPVAPPVAPPGAPPGAAAGAATDPMHGAAPVAAPEAPQAAVVEASQDASAEVAPWVAAGRRVVELVAQEFFDHERGAAWARTHAADAEAAVSSADFMAWARPALDELQASHTGLYTPLDTEYAGLLAAFAESLGVEAPELEGIGADVTAEQLVRVVHAGGPAERAGLRRGDLLLAADGAPFHPVLSFRGRSGQPVVLRVQRRAQEPPFELTVTPRRTAPRQEWVEAQRAGTRIIERGGRSIGYVPLHSGAGEEYRALVQEAIAHRFRDADALILDLRNGWGGCNPDFVLLFGEASAEPELVLSGGLELEPSPQRDEVRWRKPLFVLINGGSRSGKEILAHAIRRQGLGTLVGERTAGAVLGGSCFLLPDGSLLYLAVTDVSVDGERLEGRGVAPDVHVPDALPFADGADPQLERALELAAP